MKKDRSPAYDHEDQALAALSENGRHFLRSTLNEVHKDTSEGNRNAVIFVAAALEVLFKRRLAAEHWTLLFNDPATAKKSDLTRAKFVSVAASQLVTRLNNVTSQTIDMVVPGMIFDLRNDIVHFAPPPDDAIRVNVAAALNFAFRFIHDHMLPNLQDDERDELITLRDDIFKTFKGLADFRDTRLKELHNSLIHEAVVVTCPDCNQATLALRPKGQTNKCLFCWAQTDGEELAERYVATILHWSFGVMGGGDYPSQWCFKCHAPSFVTGVQVARRPDIIHACFSCAAVFKAEEVKSCRHCNRWMAISTNGDECIDCLEDMKQREEDLYDLEMAYRQSRM